MLLKFLIESVRRHLGGGEEGGNVMVRSVPPNTIGTSLTELFRKYEYLHSKSAPQLLGGAHDKYVSYCFVLVYHH